MTKILIKQGYFSWLQIDQPREKKEFHNWHLAMGSQEAKVENIQYKNIKINWRAVCSIIFFC